MSDSLARLCAAHGIEPHYTDFGGVVRHVPADTLAALAATFGIADAEPVSLPNIDVVRAEPSPPRCFLPASLANARAWGITCQVASLVSARNAGIGDFADLAALCAIAAVEGADFVGVNPLHALLWSDPGRVSPFFPSNRRFLNPLYIAIDWVEGFTGLTDEEGAEGAALRAGDLIDHTAVARLKDRVLRRLFARFPWTDKARTSFGGFCNAGGETLLAHGVFEVISERMVAAGGSATPDSWPEPLRQWGFSGVAAFATENRAAVDYHLWLQWLARHQLERVQRQARAAGMRIGLYLDFAIGVAPDGSAAWTDPTMTVPEVSIGAPPDPFDARGQDWGLAPLSSICLARLDGRPLSETLAAVISGGGAVRLDHAMSLARLWLIPRGEPPTDGAYVRYPLGVLLRRVAEASQDARGLVIGEDLGLVPPGFRDLMIDRNVHSYKVYFFERDQDGRAYPHSWPVNALACLLTHDMPSFCAWWQGHDIDLRVSLGRLDASRSAAAHTAREEERRALREQLECDGDATEQSIRLHAYMASSPCRLAALQIEDALGLALQVNVPGTGTEHPNWRHRLPVTVDRLVDDPIFRAHTATMCAARPK